MDKRTLNIICDIEEELKRMKEQETRIYCKGVEDNRDAGLDYRFISGSSSIDHSRGYFK